MEREKGRESLQVPARLVASEVLEPKGERRSRRGDYGAVHRAHAHRPIVRKQKCNCVKKLRFCRPVCLC